MLEIQQWKLNGWLVIRRCGAETNSSTQRSVGIQISYCGFSSVRLLFFTGGCACTQLILHSFCLAFLLKVSAYSLIAIYTRFPVSHNVLNCE